MKWLVCALVLVAGCSKKKPVPAPVVPLPVIAHQAAPPAADAGPPSLQVPRPAASRPRLQLTLRSSPLGAAAAVDGRLIGTTPVRYEMEDDGRAHDFIFTLPGHAPWKLRFSPSRDGVVHATMQPVPSGPDAG